MKSMKTTRYLFVLLFITFFSCDKTEPTAKNQLFQLLSPEESGFNFFNKVENGTEMNIFKYRNFYNGGGVAIGDINNDGLPDIYMTANMGPNKLFLNKGNMKFEDVSASAGVEGSKPWSTGVLMVDINQDGFLDIYVSNAGNLEGNNHDNDLYINNGDLTFTQKAEEYNLSKTGFSTHATFFDYDKDGDLDAYILNNSNIPVSTLDYASYRDVRAQDWDVPEAFKGVGDLLLRNDNGVFKDVSDEAGIYGSLIGFGLGVYVTDINKDLYPDIYVTNDFYERDYLYINNQDGTFSEDIKNWTSHLCLSAMGVDMADINNDGLNDIFITDMLPESNQRTKSMMEFDSYNVFKLKQRKDFYQQYIQNTLQLNNGNGTFSEIAYFSGVAKTDWSWAGLFFDMDNDGYKDIYVTNGINHDLTNIDFVDFFADEIIQKMVLTGKKEEVTEIINKMPVVPIPNYAFRNNQDLTFDNIASEWGLEIPSFSNGCAYGDLDNDGDLDLVVSNVNMESFLFENKANEISENNFLKVSLQGPKGNRNGIGASINIYFGDQVIFQEMMPSRGFQSSMEFDITVGLGQTQKIDSLRIIWPDDETQLLKNVGVNQKITLNHKEATNKWILKKNSHKNELLSEVTNDKLTRHEENLFNDFDHEGMVSIQLSQEGPALAVADVDGDNNEDIFVGGAKGQPGTLYRHLSNGKLVKVSQKVFKDDEGYEDTAASFFDIDNDGDMDLMVGSGGNEKTDQEYYYPRLYINNGKGEFSISDQNIPFAKTNISVIEPMDFDSDGDMDVFIGSRSVPGIYGINPDQILLINDGKGVFSDGTERYAYDLRDAGMVTDAKWVDVDGDEVKDLVTVSDWGSPMVFRNNKGRLSKISTSLDSLSGWWNTIQVEDLDKDGDMDFIIGNKGKNIPYSATAENPMRIWINDFDKNGTIEQITTVYENGGDYPIHMRREITMQMSSLKKENLKATDYSKRTIQELFSKEVMDNTISKHVNITETVMAVNEGKGLFKIKRLPPRTQLSCVCGIVCRDVNKDGNIDIIAGGNNFEFKPQFSRLDASFGDLLLGDGELGFEWQGYDKSGFVVKDEIKHLLPFKDKDGKEFIIVAINDNKPRVFSLN